MLAWVDSAKHLEFSHFFFALLMEDMHLCLLCKWELTTCDSSLAFFFLVPYFAPINEFGVAQNLFHENLDARSRSHDVVYIHEQIAGLVLYRVPIPNLVVYSTIRYTSQCHLRPCSIRCP